MKKRYFIDTIYDKLQDDGTLKTADDQWQEVFYEFEDDCEVVQMTVNPPHGDFSRSITILYTCLVL